MKILLIEDEKKVASFIKKGLEEEFFTVDVAFDGKQGFNLASVENYDIIVSDIMLPFLDGITLTKLLREKKITTPILLLTVKDSVKDKVTGLDAGADDYLTKPFAFEELLARVRALARRNEGNLSSLLHVADLQLDQKSHKVLRGEKEIFLTQKEYVILELLLLNKDGIVSRTKLLESIYDYHFDTGSNVIEVFINKLRAKIETGFQQQLIYTIRGSGYMIKEPAE
ncbi:MAG: response regulator transcription factor [Ignavibacteriaceae bacterium]|jgi:DNA-binding response OmpR family regulator